MYSIQGCMYVPATECGLIMTVMYNNMYKMYNMNEHSSEFTVVYQYCMNKQLLKTGGIRSRVSALLPQTKLCMFIAYASFLNHNFQLHNLKQVTKNEQNTDVAETTFRDSILPWVQLLLKKKNEDNNTNNSSCPLKVVFS